MGVCQHHPRPKESLAMNSDLSATLRESLQIALCILVLFVKFRNYIVSSTIAPFIFQMRFESPMTTYFCFFIH